MLQYVMGTLFIVNALPMNHNQNHENHESPPRYHHQYQEMDHELPPLPPSYVPAQVGIGASNYYDPYSLHHSFGEVSLHSMGPYFDPTLHHETMGSNNMMGSSINVFNYPDMPPMPIASNHHLQQIEHHTYGTPLEHDHMTQAPPSSNDQQHPPRIAQYGWQKLLGLSQLQYLYETMYEVWGTCTRKGGIEAFNRLNKEIEAHQNFLPRLLVGDKTAINVMATKARPSLLHGSIRTVSKPWAKQDFLEWVFDPNPKYNFMTKNNPIHQDGTSRPGDNLRICSWLDSNKYNRNDQDRILHVISTANNNVNKRTIQSHLKKFTKEEMDPFIRRILGPDPQDAILAAEEIYEEGLNRPSEEKQFKNPKSSGKYTGAQDQYPGQLYNQDDSFGQNSQEEQYDPTMYPHEDDEHQQHEWKALSPDFFDFDVNNLYPGSSSGGQG